MIVETKTKTPHTPGPWEVDREVAEWHGPGGVYALTVFKFDGGRGSPVAWVHPYLTLGDPAADARLISAAPDLLHALKVLADLYADLVNNDLIEDPDLVELHAARAAIQKAEGR